MYSFQLYALIYNCIWYLLLQFVKLGTLLSSISLTLMLKNQLAKEYFIFKASADWNNLPVDIRSIPSFGMFKHVYLLILRWAALLISEAVTVYTVPIKSIPWMFSPFIAFLTRIYKKNKQKKNLQCDFI